MPQIATPHGVTLEYETHGAPSDPPILMISGYVMQLIGWPRDFAQLIADGGRYVITFDNRDNGLSEKFDGRPANFERERVLTLTSLMSTTGEPDYGQSTPETLEALLTPTPDDREGYIEASKNWLGWRSKRWPDAEFVRQLAADSYDRCHYPQGANRQLAAMVASGSRADGLRRLTTPTLVIHGLDDTLIAPSGGERTAELVPGARLILVADMGHDRPLPLWEQLTGAILEHTQPPLTGDR